MSCNQKDTTSPKLPRVRFYLILEAINCSNRDITARLGLRPDFDYQIGQPIAPFSPARHDRNAWGIDSGYAFTLDVNTQIRKVTTKILGHLDKIEALIAQNQVACHLQLVIEYNSDRFPVFRLDQTFLSLATRLKADIDLDTYIV